jgi:hypothetical protein
MSFLADTGTVALNWVQHLHADFNQVPDYGSNSAAGVERYVKTVSLAHLSVLLQERLDHLPPSIRAH